MIGFLPASFTPNTSWLVPTALAFLLTHLACLHHHGGYTLHAFTTILP